MAGNNYARIVFEKNVADTLFVRPLMQSALELKILAEGDVDKLSDYPGGGKVYDSYHDPTHLLEDMVIPQIYSITKPGFVSVLSEDYERKIQENKKPGLSDFMPIFQKSIREYILSYWRSHEDFPIQEVSGYKVSEAPKWNTPLPLVLDGKYRTDVWIVSAKESAIANINAISESLLKPDYRKERLGNIHQAMLSQGVTAALEAEKKEDRNRAEKVFFHEDPSKKELNSQYSAVLFLADKLRADYCK